ncbi:ABC transporter [Nocardiopsis sp. CNR-923]|uniref:ABC transporter ATP-binding protein n=1 Tax=Nocardiopsis sp. CNR-923 TaxID=1904965 RepID=UPI000965A503|nr:ABC transporter ATP-binding protein [Nocardiopsis sp. CNR-923]OLT27954.1 ABC transporter [Nocardiopsis sp. CNR-923]
MKAIEIQGLNRSYEVKGKPDHIALKDVNLTIPQGEVHSLLGPNGAGKTTLCRILSTVLLPTSGSVRVMGHDVAKEHHRVKKCLGVVFGGDRGLYNQLTARQNLNFWASMYELGRAQRRRRVTELLDRVGLAQRADEAVQGFSRGMKQRLHLARGLVSSPAVLILDEPTVGMDPVAARDFRDLVRELRADGHTVLMTTHDMPEAAELSDRVSFIDNGELALTESPDVIGNIVSSQERIDVRGMTDTLRRRAAHIPGVSSVTETEPGLTRIEAEFGEAVRDVLMLVIEAGITDITRSRPSLEEVYLHLIGRRGMTVAQ